MITRKTIIAKLRDGLLDEGRPVIIDREMARAILEKYQGIVKADKYHTHSERRRAYMREYMRKRRGERRSETVGYQCQENS
jgi:hypothetical protein